MDELTLDNKKYFSTKHAAKITGYAKDYVGQLCREGRVEARLVGRNWYVLEEAILQHRFGEEEHGAQEALQNPIDTALQPQWESPRYVPEAPQVIPEMAPKPLSVPNYGAPEVQPSPAVLKDMQSAWQDWFKQRQNEPQELPDASEMLLADHEEAPTVAPEAEYEPQEALETAEETEEIIPIHIERMAEPAYTPARYEAEEPIRIERRPMSRPEPPEAGFSEPARARRQGIKRSNRAFSRGGSPVLRAVFVSVAGLAIVIAVIGSGVLDKTVENSDARSFITDFLSGSTQMNK